MRNPYVTGVYVVGRKHYDRHDTIDHLLQGEARAYWVIGNRRIGKTSLLRQVEFLALRRKQLLPLFWDLQGCGTFASIGRYLVEALADAGDRVRELELPTAVIERSDALELLPALRRAAGRAGRQLLLLCDETEMLIGIARNEPEAVQRLHHELTATDELRVVAASTRAMYQLDEVCAGWPTSPFLAGFEMSQTLGNLDRESTVSLITQAQSDSTVQVESKVVEAIIEATNGHPFLTQLLCSRLFHRQGVLREPSDEDMTVDPALRSFFSIDFGSLSETDRTIVWAVEEATEIAEEALAGMVKESRTALHYRLYNLECLGYLRRVLDRYAIGNRFLRNWLQMERSTLSQLPTAPPSEATLLSALERQHAHATSYLMAQLREERSNLVKLEARRARYLLDAPAKVLEDIERTEREIRRLRGLLADAASHE